MTKIVDKMTTDLNLSIFHDGYKERIEALIKSKMKGEIAQMKVKMPKKPAAKSMMDGPLNLTECDKPIQQFYSGQDEPGDCCLDITNVFS